MNHESTLQHETLRPGTLVAGRYRVVRELGGGGFWLVYEVVDEHTQARCAFKVVRELAAGEPGARERFLRQAAEAATLEHPSIARILDYGTTETSLYLVTEFAEGKNLRQWFVDERTFTSLLGPLRQVCGALTYAHSKGVFHRSLKPENILVSATGRVCVTDFGFGQRLEGQLRQAMHVAALHSIAYLTPEQTKGQRGDGRSDLYSLGVMLYELATGKLPFWDPDPVRMIFKHINELPSRPRQLNHRIPPGLETLILSLLEKDPALRCQTVTEVLDEFDRLEKQTDVDFVELERSEAAASRRVHRYPPLVGRETAETSLRSALDKARSQGGMVLIEGGCGVGKTRLVANLATYARLRNIPVLYSDPGRPVRPVLAPLLHALRDYLRKSDRNCREVLGEAAPLLETLLDGRQSPGAPTDSLATFSRYQEIFLQFVEEIAKPQGLVIVVEDVNLLEEPGLLLLRKLQARLRDWRTLLILTSRTEVGREVSQHRSLQALLDSPSLLSRLDLAPLDRAASHELVCHLAGVRTVNPELLDAMEEATGGNPLGTHELLTLATRHNLTEVVDGELRSNACDLLRASGGLLSLFEQRVQGLPQKVNYLLSIASCIGTSFDTEVLYKVSGLPADEADSILRWSQASGLIEEDWYPGRERYRFRHDVIQSVLYSALEERTRRRLHLLIGGALEQAFSGRLLDASEALVHHYGEASQWEKAVDHAVQAAEILTEAGALEAACFFYETASMLAHHLAARDHRRHLCGQRLEAIRLLL